MPLTCLLLISFGIITTIAVSGWFFLWLRPGLHSRRILVVDDSPVIQMMLCKVLQDLDYKTDSATNGQEAVRMAGATRYDLIFMDCQMPNMDGFSATQAIRAHSKKTVNTVIIVALTGDGESSDRERCLDAGMNDYMRKPFRPNQISDILRKWIG